MALTTYRRKRKFTHTPEPKGLLHPKSKTLRFVVQEHHASHLHWDFRLELDGVLKSWAVPKGPSTDISVKRLAVHVEDHPFAYRTFHGTIPKGNYGAGTVTIWDEGTYTPVEQGSSPEKMLGDALKKGELKFTLHGKKLHGKYALVKFGKGDEDNWLLIKEPLRPVGATEALGRNKRGGALKRASMPHGITPMLAKLADEPFNDPDWVYEIKWDGYRAIAEIGKGTSRLYSRNHQDFTKVYPDVVHALSAITSDAVLDGEIVAIDAKGVAHFQLLQEYPQHPQHISLIYYIFDLLYLDGRDLRKLPLLERKALLKKMLPMNAHLQYSDHIDTYGIQLFNLAKEKHIEGIMAKKKDSPYISTRSSTWLKIKNIQMQEAVICGFTQPQGHRKEFGALILGIYENSNLRYVGHTGSGFDEKKLQEIITLLKPLVTTECPFTVIPKTHMPATWVHPKKVCQVKFSEWTTDGMLRQPVFLGLRVDKKPEEVTLEHPVSSLKIASTKMQFSNLEKVYWPKEGYTKSDVISYYNAIAPFILPHLKDRPESLNRHPDGITGDNFFQKDITSAPDWVRIIPVHSDSESKTIHWLVCNDRDTLLYLANLGCIELNPWSSRIQKKEYPDYLIIDLDPYGVGFNEVITTARMVKKVMDDADIPSFIKTSGKTGLHILVPLGAKYTYEQTRQFAEVLATLVSEKLPHTTSVARNPQKREKKVYIDFLQNRFAQTIAAPYSLRPIPGAYVSTPLNWNELNDSLRPSDFTIKNIFKRLEKKGDIWKNLLSHKGLNMRKSLELLQK